MKYFLQLPITYYDFLDDVHEEVQLRMMLWNSIHEWSKAVDAWHEQPFHTINVDDIIAINEKILANCDLLAKKLPANKIVPKLGADAELMKSQLPAIKHLRNASLRTEHWLEIETIVKRNGLQNDTTTLSTFEEANAFDNELTLQIVKISERASIEKELEILLQSVEDSWKEMELTFISYREIKDAFILTHFEELQMNLDDSMIKVNTIAASDYITHIKEQVDDWIKLLQLFESTLEAWKLCQQYYLELETIFAAADMQRNLPIESEMFALVDTAWKRLMSASHRSPHALQCMTVVKTNRELLRNIDEMESIKKRLLNYLEAKRVAFPR